MYEELLHKDPELASRDLVNTIIQDALRAESQMRVLTALSDSFEDTATDRSRSQELADLILMHSRKSVWSV